MTELPINQKEYLKKYLAIGKAPGEKKKKKKKHISTRVQIIDDDVVDTTITNTIETDPIVIDEDAPQIVAIIDERPPSLRFDEKTKNPLWQPIGPVDSGSRGEQKQMIKGFKIEPKTNDKPLLRTDKSPPRRKKKKNEDRSSSRHEESPVRNVVIKEERQSVPRSPENSPRNLDVDDYSPLGRGRDDNSPPRRDRDDNPPPRRGRDYHSPPKRGGDDISPPRRHRDNSPPRRRKNDNSPLRGNGGDNSPPRRIKQEDFSPPRRSKNTDNSPPRRSRTDDDNSPPRRNRANDDNSPPRRNRKSSIDRNRSLLKNDDISPPRKRGKDGDSSSVRRRRDDSPRGSKRDGFSPRTRKYENSPPRRRDDRRNARNNRSPNDSPPRKSKREDRRIEGNNKDGEKMSKKMEKTLDGKTAGLQNARELIAETQNFHQREDKLFKSLTKDVSGETASTVHRDRKTGKIRNLEEEEERQRQKREEEEKNKEKYERWGRGLAQVENREQQIKEQLHEMSKPLARYADDEDLEKYLKEQEREGDPMLAYIRKKKRKKAAEAGEVMKPLFEGEFNPNRYGIRPGHRWDGVDRSNGYEKKWFEVQNQKKAQQEESYKWSTEDM